MTQIDFTPSPEQKLIIKDLLSGHHVLVNAVAGSGKTSTIAYLVSMLNLNQPDKRTLILTYNKELQVETEKRLKNLGLKNVTAYTIHGYATRLLKTNKNIDFGDLPYVKDNEQLATVLNKHPQMGHWDYIVFDEVQDASLPYMLFFKAMIDQNPQAKVLVLGDEKQMIYESNGARSVYLTAFDKFMGLDMVHRNLSYSFRVPNVICQAINDSCLHGTHYLEGHEHKTQDGKQIGKLFFLFDEKMTKINQKIISFVTSLIESGKAKPDDFFILSHSVDTSRKINEPLQELANALVAKGIPVFSPILPEYNAKQGELHGKLVINTINRSKGRERRFVILYGFDLVHYWNWVNGPLNEMPNLHYVAWTRAKEMLIVACELKKPKNMPKIIADHNPNMRGCGSVLPYVDWSKLAAFGQTSVLADYKPFYHYLGLQKTKYLKIEPSDSPVKYVNTTFLNRLYSLTESLVIEHQKPAYNLQITTALKKQTDTDNLLFKVQLVVLNSKWLLLEYIHQAYPLKFQHILDQIWQYFCIKYSTDNGYWHKKLAPYFDGTKNLTIDNYVDWPRHEQLMFWTIDEALMRNDLTFFQLPHYHWLDNFKQLNLIQALFEKFKIADFAYEMPVQLTITTPQAATAVQQNTEETVVVQYGNTTMTTHHQHVIDFNVQKEKVSLEITGRTDLVVPGKIFELKCEDSLSIENKIQLLFYMYCANITYQAYLSKKSAIDAQLNNEYDSFRKSNNNVGFDEWKNKTYPFFAQPIDSGVLLNYKTGEYFVLKNDEVQIKKIVEEIVNYKLLTTTDDLPFDIVYQEFQNAEQAVQAGTFFVQKK